MLRCLPETNRDDLDRRRWRTWRRIASGLALAGLALSQSAAAAEARMYRVLHVCACVPAVTADERDVLIEFMSVSFAEPE
jgi:hypothetical protein